MFHLAIDIGASSGRHIVGWRDGAGAVQTREVHRFPNGAERSEGRLIWDVEALEREVRAGIDRALEQYPGLASLSVDTWGVDYVLLRGDDPVRPCYAYRDERTEAVIDQVHALVPFAELYARTGIQFQPFNTVYQLFADKLAGRLEGVTDMLMLPEYLMYRLTGHKAREYTNATTTGLVNAAAGEFDREIVRRLGLPEQLFPPLSRPGTAVGEYKGVQVILCATHDTASAVEGVLAAAVSPALPARPCELAGASQPYISSGTWSLLGIRTERPLTDAGSMAANWSNEGGVGYNRYQKNIMGMWLVNGLRDELCPDMPFSEVVRAAQESGCTLTVDANDDSFLAPESMKAAFDRAAGGRLSTVGDYFCCAYRSLALSYQKAVAELEHNTGRTCQRLYIVGGGAKNQYLNHLTAQATGKEIVALPIEATALGNLKIQMEAFA